MSTNLNSNNDLLPVNHDVSVPDDSWSLDQLQDAAKSKNDEILECFKRLAIHVYRLGRVLTVAKPKAKHGEWGPFLAHARITVATDYRARKLFEFFKSEAELDGLPICDAYQKAGIPLGKTAGSVPAQVKLLGLTHVPSGSAEDDSVVANDEEPSEVGSDESLDIDDLAAFDMDDVSGSSDETSSIAMLNAPEVSPPAKPTKRASKPRSEQVEKPPIEVKKLVLRLVTLCAMANVLSKDVKAAAANGKELQGLLGQIGRLSQLVEAIRAAISQG